MSEDIRLSTIDAVPHTVQEENGQSVFVEKVIPMDDTRYKLELPLYQLLSVEWEPYIDMPLSELDLGVRAFNCLHRGKKKDGTIVVCKTVGEVLKLSPLQLSNYRNMGRLSIDRIILVLGLIVLSGNEQREEKSLATALPVSRDCEKQVMAMLHSTGYELSDLSDSDKAAFWDYASASEIIGKELALDAVNGSGTVVDVMQMLRDYYKTHSELYERRKKLEDIVNSLSLEMKRLPVKPFILAYRVSVGEAKSSFTVSVDSETTVSDFLYSIRDGLIDQEADFIMAFVSWLKFDVAVLCRPMRYCIEKQRNNARWAFEQRVTGETLEAVGNAMGVTRERIRQLERKVAKSMAYAYHTQRKQHDVVAVLYAMKGGGAALRFDEVSQQVGDANAQLIWYLAKKDFINCDEYYFSHQSNVIIFGDGSADVDLLPLIEELPAVIEQSEMPHYISRFVEKYGVDPELLRIQLQSLYKCDGIFYHRGRFTVIFMCDYILRRKFPTGYKVSDSLDQQRFLSYLFEVFGRKSRMTAHALDTKINQVGVLIDRGKYIHPSYINVEKEIIDEVIDYIKNSPRAALTYTELFNTFSKRFMGTQINNKYCLQGVLRLSDCPFVLRKDYVTKEPDKNLALEFERFVEQNGRVHKSNLLEEFNGLSEVNLAFFCQRLSTIVVLDGGYYMHASQLNLCDADYEQQRNFLSAACSEAPISARLLFKEYKVHFMDFMTRNHIETHSNLFGILQYMFRKDFFFSRPYISLTNEHRLTHHHVLLQHLTHVNSIQIADLIDICQRNGISFVSSRTLMTSIEPDFVRIGKATLMRKEFVGIDDDSVLDTVLQINELVRANKGYCASKNIHDFSCFPKLNIPWNVYLLESIASLAGDLLTVLRMITTNIYIPIDIYLGDEFIAEDMDSLIIKVLQRENQLEPFASKEEVFHWLREQGLCNVKLPSFLETKGHLIYDDSGTLHIQ